MNALTGCLSNHSSYSVSQSGSCLTLHCTHRSLRSRSLRNHSEAADSLVGRNLAAAAGISFQRIVKAVGISCMGHRLSLDSQWLLEPTGTDCMDHSIGPGFL